MGAGRARRRRARTRSLVLIVGVALTSAVPPLRGGGAAAQTIPDRERLATELSTATGGSAQLAVHERTGLVRFVGTAPGKPVPRAAGVAAGDGPAAAARGFVRDYGTLFGIDDPNGQLRLLREKRAGGGRSSVRFQQVHHGVPVLGGELIVGVDSAGNVLSANGEALPELSLDVTPGLGGREARLRAVEAIAKARGIPTAGMQASDPSVWVYDARLLGGPGLPVPRLVWRTEVAGDDPEPFDELVLIDALTGGVALHFDQHAHALVRRVCDRQNVRQIETCVAPYARVEGQAPTGITQVDLAYRYSGDTYNYYAFGFGRDSLDDAGLPLLSTVRYCPQEIPPGSGQPPCPYRNAFWNGSQMTYGDGYASADDVVAHELTHGVTDFESGLFYYYQSGAINESLSDVFGELVDLGNGSGNDTAAVRWLLGENVPTGALRNMANPPQFSDPDRIQSSLYASTTGDNGGVHTNSGVNNKAAFLLVDGGTFNGKTVTALGVTKAAHIYYEAQVHLLTSGSDYADLYNILHQACLNLVGTVGITAANCIEVRDATDATEMNLQPVTGFTNTRRAVVPGGTGAPEPLLRQPGEREQRQLEHQQSDRQCRLGLYHRVCHQRCAEPLWPRHRRQVRPAGGAHRQRHTTCGPDDLPAFQPRL